VQYHGNMQFMDAIGPVIRLADDMDLHPIKLLRDWQVNEDARTVFHGPSKLVFVIDYDPPPEGAWVRPSDLSAQMAHVCDGGKLPPPPVLQQIGKDAIHAFVLLADVCNPPTDSDEIPF
jgi:hypothetical protein